MKNSINLFATVCILFLLSFTTNAKADNWSGQWNTRHGVVVITKTGNSYTGTFPKGKFTEMREQDGMLLGRYTRSISKGRDNSGLGTKGEFRFILTADKTKFNGYHKSETDRKWGTENWNGVKIFGMVMPVIVSNDIAIATPASWTGTWETDTFGRLKIWDTGTKYKSTTAISIEGRFWIKGSGDYIDIFDVTGYRRDYSPKEFEGTFKHGDRDGYIVIKYGSPTDNDFSGYLNYNMIYPRNGKVMVPEKRVYIKGHRTSSAKPNMNDY